MWQTMQRNVFRLILSILIYNEVTYVRLFVCLFVHMLEVTEVEKFFHQWDVTLSISDLDPSLFKKTTEIFLKPLII